MENVSNVSNAPAPEDPPPAVPPEPEVDDKEEVECGVFLRNPEISHTRTVWSMDAETMRSSFGWNLADMT